MLRVVVLASAIALSMGAGAASPAPAASASSAADAVRQRLQLSPVLAGEFEQRKVLEGFRNPLVSHGEFLVARGQGVWWHTTKPFESTLVVTRSRLVTHAPDGTSNDGVDATSEPGLRQVNEMIFSLLGGDVDALAQRFDVAAQTTSSGWQLTLTPKDANVAKFLRRATLAGDRFVDSVYLDEARGDSTQIRFSHQSPAAALTADERARFK